MTWQTISTGSADTLRLGELLGSKLRGGDVVELVSDLGGGKTTLTQGLAKGLGSQDTVSSPTFTLKKVYRGRAGLEIHHFDFYRLNDPGMVADQLAESVNDAQVVTVVEWSQIVKDVLPEQRLTIELTPTAHNPEGREITITYSPNLDDIIRAAATEWDEVRP